ncbi:hypothetical protein BGX21_011435 [Mortierella sp. AD011]|nr:hypothetical protein BGX20_001749 [Mortierella sp. AD010]KAF9390593.1 hypothetical protein BGX21_011435 [Mortierella sp. AD011]
MTHQFVNVASLVPDQHHCNLELRVLSVETVTETVHPENQVNLLARNARLRVLNAHVNMYRGFMRLEVNEDDEGDADGRGKPSITAISDDEDRDEDESVVTSSSATGDNSHIAPVAPGANMFGASGAAATPAAASSPMSTVTIASGSSSHSQVSSPSLPLPSRDQLEVEMRLGTGGSVPLMEYYRTNEFTYFSTVEPVGR